MPAAPRVAQPGATATATHPVRPPSPSQQLGWPRRVSRWAKTLSFLLLSPRHWAAEPLSSAPWRAERCFTPLLLAPARVRAPGWGDGCKAGPNPPPGGHERAPRGRWAAGTRRPLLLAAVGHSPCDRGTAQPRRSCGPSDALEGLLSLSEGFNSPLLPGGMWGTAVSLPPLPPSFSSRGE